MAGDALLRGGPHDGMVVPRKAVDTHAFVTKTDGSGRQHLSIYYRVVSDVFAFVATIHQSIPKGRGVP